MTTILNGSSSGIPLGPGYTLFAPGFTGSVTVHDAKDTRTRSTAPLLFPEELERVLTEGNMIQLHTISTQLDSGPPAIGRSRFRSGGNEDAIALEMHDLGDEVGQVLLAFDESGVATWHFPEKASPAGKKRFVIRSPQVVIPEGTEPQNRGLIQFAGKLLKTFIYKITDPLIGVIGEKTAETWESKRRPYGLRSFTPDTYREAGVGNLNESGLRHLADGPALLFVHGTFSTAHHGFSRLPQQTMKTLYDRYNGRVFAFNHHTMSHDPIKNVEWFMNHIPNDLRLNVDIVSHSRGGLLARTLAGEHPDRPVDTGRLTVRRIVFAGTPNRGTVLCDPNHIPDLIDRYTTLLNLLPTGPVGELLDAVITVVKIIGHGILNGLDGLASMNPAGDFIKELNKGPRGTTEFFGLTANYEPSNPGLIAYLKDQTIDRIFGKAANDLVVPTDGVEPANKQIADLHRFIASKAVHHNDYFGQPETESHLLSWLIP